MGIADTYFSDNNILFQDVMDNICDNMSSVYFPSEFNRYYSVQIPAKTSEYDLAFIKLPSNVNIVSFANGRITLCDTPEVKIESELQLFNSTSDNGEALEEFLYAYHADGIVVQRDTVQKTLLILARISPKNESILPDDLKLGFKGLYYGLCIEDARLVYDSLRKLSDSFKNEISTNQKVMPMRQNPIKNPRVSRL